MNPENINTLISQRKTQLTDIEGKLEKINSVTGALITEAVGLRAVIKELEGLLVEKEASPKA